jgi:hypothetical protein
LEYQLYNKYEALFTAYIASSAAVCLGLYLFYVDEKQMHTDLGKQ